MSGRNGASKLTYKRPDSGYDVCDIVRDEKHPVRVKLRRYMERFDIKPGSLPGDIRTTTFRAKYISSNMELGEKILHFMEEYTTEEIMAAIHGEGSGSLMPLSKFGLN